MERKERRHHTGEFKLEAVRLADVGDKTKAKVARELGVQELLTCDLLRTRTQMFR